MEVKNLKDLLKIIKRQRRKNRKEKTRILVDPFRKIYVPGRANRENGSEKIIRNNTRKFTRTEESTF